MRKKIITLLFIFISIQSKAQIDTTLQDYFPLEIGNYWEFRDNLFNLWKISAIKDTVMPNGKQYIVFKDSTDWVGGNIQFNYYRIDDSMRVWEYAIGPGTCDDEYLIFNLTLPDSTFWTTCRELVIDYEHNFPALLWTLQEYYSALNLLTTSKTFSGAVIDTISGDTLYEGSFYYPHRELAKGIGIAYRTGEAGNTIYITGAIIRGAQYGTIVSVDEEDYIFKDKESNFEIYPNPFNSETIFSFSLSRYSNVKIKLYDILGKQIATIFDENLSAGKYQRRFNPAKINSNGISSGIYLITYQTDKNFITKKIIILK